MGVDYYVCPSCKEAFPDFDAWNCYVCEESICDNCREKAGETCRGEAICPPCSIGYVDPEYLLDFIVEELELNLEEWKDKYRKSEEEE